MGSEYLAKLLSKHLESVIRAGIPGIASLINSSIDELEAEMARLGRPIAIDAGAQLYTILELCRDFDWVFKEHMDGGPPGGDRIYIVFDHQLLAAFRKLPLDQLLPNLLHLSLRNCLLQGAVPDFSSIPELSYFCIMLNYCCQDLWVFEWSMVHLNLVQSILNLLVHKSCSCIC
ncbi:hypothetical protein RIF29_16275 [Crotalaria pallida]|uniref:Dynamin stalk domain-containing protein n=1 Tax=Crotalaria pallida TaxID=3830 RepID=A0AAN9FGY9_CROPI